MKKSYHACNRDNDGNYTCFTPLAIELNGFSVLTDSNHMQCNILDSLLFGEYCNVKSLYAYFILLCELRNYGAAAPRRSSEGRLCSCGLITGATLSAPKERYDPVQDCYEKHANTTDQTEFLGMVYCNATFDSYLCWPPTPAGKVATQNCPPARLSDTTRFAVRQCGDSGLWLGRRPNESTAVGWTNYTPCFPPEVQTLFVQVYDDDETDAQLKFEIAQRTRYLEIAGFSISLIALVISLVIFSHYRSLRNNRTRIHKSLFSAMVVQVLIRLTVYIDQALIRSVVDPSTYQEVPMRGIDNMPYLCEASYVLLEYAITVMFMWMFIEGLYLHNVVTANALRENISHLFYYAMGWGLPVAVTAIWSTTTALHYQRDEVKKCWYGYNFSSLYWIMQGPRLAVVMINLVFLLNIMRVLIVKLRRSENSEVEKVRKAVRAALVLLPLLGITNALDMIEAPLAGSVWEFGLWSYSTHFLRSFQGLFIALIYCFLNGEVRLVLKKHYDNYMAMRTDARRHRDSVFNFRSSSGENRPRQQNNDQDGNDKPVWMPLTLMRWKRLSSTTQNQTSETEFGPENSQDKKHNVLPELEPDQPPTMATATDPNIERDGEVYVAA